MTWSKENQDDIDNKSLPNKYKSCPSCGHRILCKEQAAIHELPGLPAGVKFDPTDQELLEHLEGKVKTDTGKLHPLIDEFIPTLEGENGICYTHPEKLPGVTRDGLIRHFFHRPSKAYTTGTRKRRKVHTADHEEGGETRWHKTGKTRPVFVGGKYCKGFKKILVLYTNYGKQRKPEKTNWVMHQYHLGSNEEEKDGELVVSKVFYQTQPRQCGSGTTTTAGSKLLESKLVDHHNIIIRNHSAGGHDINHVPVGALKEAGANVVVDHFYNSSTGGLIIPYGASGSSRASPTPQLVMPNFVVHDTSTGPSFLP